MSQKAVNWLATLEGLKPIEFVVLFRLCYCHNPKHGCFPSQQYLKEVCQVSNGTLNNHLKSLEAKGYIKRTKRFSKVSRRQQSTSYTLGFDIPANKKPTPNIGDGTGADSNKTTYPTPVNTESRLQNMETKEVIEPVNNYTASAREEILIACGIDITGITEDGTYVGGLGDMAEVNRWINDLELSHEEILAVIDDVKQRKPGWQPNTLKFFTGAMQDFAGQKLEPALTPTRGGHRNGIRHRTEEQRLEQIERAARGSFI